MRRILSLIAGCSVLLIALAVWWFAQPANPINVANFDRIEAGLTENEVVQLLGTCDPDDGNIEIQGDLRSAVKCWSRPNQGTIRDTILVGFTWKEGLWTVENKYCFIPSPWDRFKAWWGGYELLPDRHLPHMPNPGRGKRLEEAA